MTRWARPDDLQSPCRRLGSGRGYAVHLDKAGGVELRRNAQRHGRPLAEGGARQKARSVPSGTMSSTSPPLLLEAAGLPEPKIVNGVPQTPIEGVSMVYSFNDAKAEDRHLTQYFEIFGNRAIYHDGWFAGTVHKAPWEVQTTGNARERYLGALRHADRLQPGKRPGETKPGQAQGDAGPVHEGSGQISACSPSTTVVSSA